jgi:DNA-binding response OmpR family regulator
LGTRPDVLLVSNHPDTAEVYSSALEAAGFSVLCAPDVEAALAVIGPDAPRGIIVDLLPRQDPVALGAMLREGRPATFLVGLLSMEIPLSALKPVLDVFDDVVLVPCSPEALVVRLLKLDRTRQRQPSS